ncbi:alpha-(1,3)-fucosyltransferase 10-like [Ylistrum balloti]|uniref:alpha-(1,3)-fucosyltransferase 10-like n=1 Tax=Ylistrum balloti TaxID=509963 RepID=UPI002905D5AD|nr:alpha-(1,3)-fucosyltransferase 10-like [Ylistrum balloti]
MPSHRLLFRAFLYLICLSVLVPFIIFVSENYFYGHSDSTSEFEQEALEETKDRHDPSGEMKAIKEVITTPIVLWWTPFTGDPGSYKRCGEHRCFFTVDRHYRRHNKTKAFMFYGTDLDDVDLPLPRNSHQHWALLHEESPKNNYIYSHKSVVTLFNHTCTFKRESDYPIPTQYLPSLEWLSNREYMVPTAEKNRLQKTELSPLMYAHSDCGTPSDRDTYVELLMKHIGVDSYGKCLHNKDLPPHLQHPIQGMDHVDFYKLISKYKFSLAFENAVCDDYMTEKLWRPLMVGSVPIVMGSPKVKDFLPAKHSAIIVEDFVSIKQLAEYIKFLNENDDEYEKYLAWKKTGIENKYLIELMKNREWGVDGSHGTKYHNFIDGFECFVCQRINENEKLTKLGKKPRAYLSSHNHYGCPGPIAYNSEGTRYGPEGVNSWDYEFANSRYTAAAIRYHVDRGVPYTKQQLLATANRMKDEDL